MEVRPTVRRFPGAAFALILGLVAALAVAMTLSIGGWGLTIGSHAAPGTTTTQTQHATQQPPAAGSTCVGEGCAP